MESLKRLLFLTPNALVALTIITWLAVALERLRKRQAPKWFWVELVAVSLLLPLLWAGWPHWGLVRYLPHLIFRTSNLYLHVAIIQLPAVLALPAVFVYRRSPGYLLSGAGGIYLLLFGVIMLFYNGGLIG